MALGIINGKVAGIYNAGTRSHPRFVVEYIRPDHQNRNYTMNTALDGNLETYRGKYLQVEITMNFGILFNKEWFTDVPL